MKNLYFLLTFLLAGCILFSCKKLQEAPLGSNKGNSTKTTNGGDTTTQPIIPIDANMLAGTWQVVNDTSTTVPWGLWQGRPTTGQNYVGSSADYYKFTADGNAFTRLNNVIDTANYTISRDSVHMVYTYFNNQQQSGGIYNSFWRVTNLTAHTATITWQFISPETATISVTYLRK